MDPELDPIVATAELLLTQVPPPVDPVNEIGNPRQIVDGAVIDGKGFTVIGVVTKQPVGRV